MTPEMHEVPILLWETPQLSSPEPGTPRLRYRRQRCHSSGAISQPLLADRIVLHPEIGLNRYVCSAVFDWVQIHLPIATWKQEINLQKTATSILRRMGSASTVWCKPYEAGGYWMKIQNPKPNELVALAGALCARYELDCDAGDLSILGFELSVDFRIRGARNHEQADLDLLRWTMVEVLKRHFQVRISDDPRSRPRFYTGGSSQKAQRTVDDNKPGKIGARHCLSRLGISPARAFHFDAGAYHQPPVARTFYAGDSAKDLVVYRIMDKRTDNRIPDEDTAILLPLPEQRARVEVSFPMVKGQPPIPPEIGLERLGDLYTFDHHRLRKTLFDFHLPTVAEGDLEDILPFPTAVTEQFAFDKAGVFGLDAFQRMANAVHHARARRREIDVPAPRLGKKGYLVAYSKLNQKVMRALKSLAAEWQASRSHAM